MSACSLHLWLSHCLLRDSEEPARNAGALGLIPGLGRSPGEENGNPLQYSCLENAIWEDSIQRILARLRSMGL